MASLKYLAGSSLQTVTLGSAYTAADGTMTLTSGHGARLPTAGDFWMAHDNGSGTVRLFKVTSRSTDVLTITPDATEGSGDGNIASGQTLRWALTVAALTQLRADLSSYGAYASLPATCKKGDRYLTSDSIYEFLATADDTWTAFHNGQKVVIPPTASWSWDNQESATVDFTYGYGYFHDPGGAGASDYRMYYRSVTAPYTVIAKVRINFAQGNYCSTGIGIRDSGGKIKMFGPAFNNANSIYGFYIAATPNSGESARGTRLDVMPGFDWWLKIVDDNTNLTLSYSLDGVTWIQYYQATRTTDLTGTLAGVVINAWAASTIQCMLISWEVT